jgi:hypothetical protein
VPQRSVLAGRVLSGLGVVFLLVDATMKFFLSPEALAATSDLGYDPAVVPSLGALQFVLLAVYLVPRTSVFGAILWTGYLGGAVATHVRVGNPWASHILFPVYIGLLLWGGLWLRDGRLRALLPWRGPVPMIPTGPGGL